MSSLRAVETARDLTCFDQKLMTLRHVYFPESADPLFLASVGMLLVSSTTRGGAAGSVRK